MRILYEEGNSFRNLKILYLHNLFGLKMDIFSEILDWVKSEMNKCEFSGLSEKKT